MAAYFTAELGKAGKYQINEDFGNKERAKVEILQKLPPSELHDERKGKSSDANDRSGKIQSRDRSQSNGQIEDQRELRAFAKS